MHTTLRPVSHGFGQKFEGWAGSMCPPETPGVWSAHAFFAFGYRAPHVKPGSLDPAPAPDQYGHPVQNSEIFIVSMSLSG